MSSRKTKTLRRKESIKSGVIHRYFGPRLKPRERMFSKWASHAASLISICSYYSAKFSDHSPVEKEDIPDRSPSLNKAMIDAFFVRRNNLRT